jgi:hypothetical protein
VPDKVWAHYILSLAEGDKLLCRKCFDTIAELTDGGAHAREHGGAIMHYAWGPDAPEGSPGRKRWDERMPAHLRCVAE